MISIRVIRIIGLAALLASGTLSAQTLIPHVFQSDQPALAEEVNANFASLDQAVVGLLQSATLRTVVVSPVPGNAVASGTALRDSLAAIDSPAADNRYLLKLEPGDYDLGGGGLTLREYVDVEGSGRGMTRILMSGSTITPASNIEIRSLGVLATYGSSGGTAIQSIALASYSVRDISVVVSGTGGGVNGISGIASGSAITARDVQIAVSGGLFSGGVTAATGLSIDIRNSIVSATGATNFNRAISSNASEITLIDVDAIATGNGPRAVQTNGRSTIMNSRLIADFPLTIDGVSELPVLVSNTQLTGMYDAGSPYLTMVGCFDASFAPIADTL